MRRDGNDNEELQQEQADAWFQQEMADLACLMIELQENRDEEA